MADSQIIDAEFVDIAQDGVEYERGSKPAPKGKRKRTPATTPRPPKTNQKPETTTVSPDPFGRLDLLVSAGVKQVILNSGDPALFALYGKYGGFVDDLASKWLGPVKTKRGR